MNPLFVPSKQTFCHKLFVTNITIVHGFLLLVNLFKLSLTCSCGLSLAIMQRYTYRTANNKPIFKIFI
jgi:hypothetical protein